MSLSLRLYRESDFPILLRWYAKGDVFSYATGHHSLSSSLPAFTADNPGIRMICIDNGKAIGAIVASKKELLKETVLWITLLLIDEKEQRKGFGTDALNKLFGLCGYRTKLKKVFVAVNPENTSGLAFWHANGFSEVHKDQIEESVTKKVVILQLESEL